MATKPQSILSIGEQTYCIQPGEKLKLSKSQIAKLATFEKNDYVPLTCINWNKGTFNKGDLSTICKDYSAADDVWSPEFLAGEINIKTSYSHFVETDQ